MAAIEPRLAEMEKQARRVVDGTNGGLEFLRTVGERLDPLVGTHAQAAELQNGTAYAVAFRAIYDAMGIA
jgi:hypothetical protein